MSKPERVPFVFLELYVCDTEKFAVTRCGDMFHLTCIVNLQIRMQSGMHLSLRAVEVPFKCPICRTAVRQSQFTSIIEGLLKYSIR